MTDKKSAMLDKVRKLLAKAEGGATPEEAETFRAKADELMTAYAIETWQVEMAAEGDQRKSLPEKRMFSFDWWWSREIAVRDELWEMFNDVARHMRCVVIVKHLDYRAKAIPVIGLPADLDYFDLLFTHLMLDLAKQTSPQPNAALSLEENLQAMKQAGVPWPEVARKLLDAGIIEPKEGESVQAARKRYSDRLPRRYRAWCKAEGLRQDYTDQRAFRRNFADGYVSVIYSRLWNLRDAAENSGSALALRDIRQVVRDAVWEFYPDLKPHEKGCECERCKQRRKPVRYRQDNRKVDYAARAAGEAAGKRARIDVSPSNRVKGGGNRALGS